jgi:V8-like Glu-specific endopeptidase
MEYKMIHKYALLSLALLGLLGSPSYAQDADTDIMTLRNEDGNVTALQELWTDELNADNPIPFPVLPEEEFEKFDQEPPSEEDKFTIEPFGDEVNLGTPFATNVNVAPYKFGGRLGIRFQAGSGSCSGSFVGSTSVILTAAHCVQSAQTGEWARDLVFSRAHKNGASDLFGWTCVGTKRGWTNGGNRYKWDYAFIKVNRPYSGYLGMRGGTPFRTFEALGYPRNYGGTQVMHSVFGNLGAVANDIVEMNGNPMTQGSSGGPWVGSGSSVFSNVSHGIQNRPGRVYGPRFDRETLDLFNYVNRGCR